MLCTCPTHSPLTVFLPDVVSRNHSELHTLSVVSYLCLSCQCPSAVSSKGYGCLITVARATGFIEMCGPPGSLSAKHSMGNAYNFIPFSKYQRWLDNG